MVEVSIIVPTHRRGGIDITLLGMRDQVFRDFEVILIDHRYEHRHRDVTRMADEYGIPLIHVPEYRRNGKWCVSLPAYNTGVAVARGRILIFLSDWTYVPPGWLEAHLQHHNAKPTYVTGRSIRYRGVEQEAFSEIQTFPQPFNPQEWANKPYYQITGPGGAGPMPTYAWVFMVNDSVPRDVVVALNGFDEIYNRGRGAADSEWGLRLQVAGVRMWYYPDACTFSPCPRAVYPQMPGPAEGRADGRWTKEDDYNYFYNKRQHEIQSTGQVRARNPFDIRELSKRLDSWREAEDIDTSSLDMSDREFWGKDVWPEDDDYVIARSEAARVAEIDREPTFCGSSERRSMTTEERPPERITLNPEDVGRLEDVLGEGDSIFQPAEPETAPGEPTDPEDIEREPSPAAEAAAPPVAPPPPPGDPVAERGISDGSLVCTVCRGLIGAGETYVKTDVRGFNHLDPCSHRA